MALLAGRSITKSFGSRLFLDGADLSIEPAARIGMVAPEELLLPTRSLSGGQRKLIALAACLEQQPDVLLLDEPEAHLDNDGRARVEALTRCFEGAVVAISHDRYLLDEIATQIASLDGGGSDSGLATTSALSGE